MNKTSTEKTNDQVAKGQVKSHQPKFPSDLDNLTEEDIQTWFTVGEAAGRKILKVKPEMLSQESVEGDPVFLGKVSTYKKQGPGVVGLVFDDDF